MQETSLQNPCVFPTTEVFYDLTCCSCHSRSAVNILLTLVLHPAEHRLGRNGRQIRASTAIPASYWRRRGHHLPWHRRPRFHPPLFVCRSVPGMWHLSGQNKYFPTFLYVVHTTRFISGASYTVRTDVGSKGVDFLESVIVIINVVVVIRH
jgi:hypothetical protein